LRLLPLRRGARLCPRRMQPCPRRRQRCRKFLHRDFLPSSLEIADSFTLEAARRDLGKSIVPAGSAHLLVDLDGQRGEACAAKRRRFANCSRRKNQNALEMANGEIDCEKLWALRREFSNSLRATGLTKLNQDVVVPRSRIVDLVEFAEKLQVRYGFSIACFGHAGDGNIHVNIMADRYNREAAVREKVDRALDELFCTGAGLGRRDHGPNTESGWRKKRWWPDATSEVARDFHRKLKEIGRSGWKS